MISAQIIVILGGGDIGCETADLLSSQAKNITIVERWRKYTPLETLKNQATSGQPCGVLQKLD